jgi:LuxR family transcriptional regulator, maltose regulon positive regulatory protein
VTGLNRQLGLPEDIRSSVVPPATAVRIRRPEPPRRLVSRRRLLEKLEPPDVDRVPGAPVVLVTGPPGAGKTTLLSGWAAGVGRADGLTPPCVAWVTVEAGDGVAALWSALLAAIAEAGPDAPWLRKLSVPQGTVERGFVAHVTQLLGELEQPLWLVLDEVENLTDVWALRSMDLFLRWASRPVRVVLAGRVEPPLPWHRLRLDGRLVEIDAGDLALSQTETVELFAGHDVELAGPDLELLHGRTEGWAAALRLAAISLEVHPDRRVFLRGFAGDDRAVAEYLFEEIYARQPADIREFLLGTSICEQLTPSLATALTARDDAGAILERLVRRNALTVRLGDGDGWYRYHHLLRTFLRAELDRTAAARRRDLHVTALSWFQSRGDGLRAIDHAVAAGDADLVTRLVRRFGLQVVMSGDAAALRPLLSAAPVAALDRPVVALVAVAAALDDGDLTAADAFMERVPTPGPDPYCRRLRAALLLYRARLRGDVARELAALLEALTGPSGDPDLDLLTLAERGTARLRLLELDEAERDLCDALALARTHRRDHVALHCLVSLGAIGSSRSDLVVAGDRAREAIDFAAERGWARTSTCTYAHALAGLAAYQRVDDDEARRCGALAVESVGGPADPTVRFAAVALDARTAYEVSDDRHALAHGIGRAWDELGSAYVALPLVSYAAVPHVRMCLRVGEARWAQEIARLAAARLGESGEVGLMAALLQLHRGRITAARAELAPVVTGTLPCVVMTTCIEAELLDALLAEAAGDQTVAHARVASAVRLAAPRDMLRPFAETGAPLRELLAAGIGRFGRDDAFAQQALAVLPADPAGAGQLLSDREREVLAELPSMRTVDEIAAGLFLSTNTVKTHVRSIYRKLGVQNRRDAMVAARRLGLL